MISSTRCVDVRSVYVCGREENEEGEEEGSGGRGGRGERRTGVNSPTLMANHISGST